MNRIALATLSSGSLLLANLASAQSPVFDLAGAVAGDQFSHSLTAIGDVDGDAVEDWAVGAPFSDENGSMSGSVHVYSGASGLELFALLGDSAGDLFGFSVAGADLNGDGIADLAVGAYADDAAAADAGTIYVYSGLDNSLMYSISGSNSGDNLGFALDRVPDVDGDGLEDLLVGAWIADAGTQNSGEVLLLKGSNGLVLQTFGGQQAFEFFGKAVAGLADVNGDGFGDVLIGAPGNSAGGVGAGAAYVYSGANGALLQTHRGDSVGDSFGTSVSAAGDLDADGAADFLVGAPGSDQVAQNTGLARVFSGSLGSVLFDVFGLAAGDNFGSAVGGGADFTGDGIADLLVGAPAADRNGLSSGQLFVLSGLDGSPISITDGASSGARYGAALCRAGDRDGDGADELLVGAWGEDAGAGPFSGVLHVLTFGQNAPLTPIYCSSTNNSFGTAASISALGSTSIATSDFALDVEGAIASVPGLFFYGPEEMQVPFGDGFLCIRGQISRLPTVTTDAFGHVTFPINLAAQRGPDGLILAGSTWKFQFWYRDAQSATAAFNLSDGLSATFID